MPLIEYKGVEVHRKEHIVLRDVDFTVDPGEMVYLIGRVGSGKSSLLKTIYADVPIASGEARVLDFDLTSLKRKRVPMLRRRLGVVFQDFRLLTDRSVLQNLDFVLRATGWREKERREEQIDAVLRRVGMINKEYKMPHELSGGEQQRIALARALLNNPEIILADEPTGNLDPEAGMQIAALFREIADQGTAVVMATHNLSLIENFSGRVLCCADKHISPA